jgi:hypothetical protein
MHYVVSQIVGSTEQTMRGLKVEVAMLAVWSVVLTLFALTIRRDSQRKRESPMGWRSCLRFAGGKSPKHATQVFSPYFATGQIPIWNTSAQFVFQKGPGTDTVKRGSPDYPKLRSGNPVGCEPWDLLWQY